MLWVVLFIEMYSFPRDGADDTDIDEIDLYLSFMCSNVDSLVEYSLSHSISRFSTLFITSDMYPRMLKNLNENKVS